MIPLHAIQYVELSDIFAEAEVGEPFTNLFNETMDQTNSEQEKIRLVKVTELTNVLKTMEEDGTDDSMTEDVYAWSIATMRRALSRVTIGALVNIFG